MGACTFITVAKGKTAKEAFNAACEKARYDFGHAGYTGTIAEKIEFVTITLPAGYEPGDYAHELLEQDDPRVSDKWGPAGAIRIDADTWLFFGWASE
jgi:hypothetical protein